MVGFFLFLLGLVLYFVFGFQNAFKMRERELERKKRIGKGTYCRLEFQLFCKYRDELFEKYEDEIDLINTSSGDTVPSSRAKMVYKDNKRIMALYEALEKTQKEIKARGYKVCIPDGRMPAYEKYNEATVFNLRQRFENIGVYEGNSWIENIEKDRNPYEVFGIKYDEYAKKNGYPSEEEIWDNGRWQFIANYPEYQKYIKHHRWSDNMLHCR